MIQYYTIHNVLSNVLNDLGRVNDVSNGHKYIGSNTLLKIILNIKK